MNRIQRKMKRKQNLVQQFSTKNQVQQNRINLLPQFLMKSKNKRKVFKVQLFSIMNLLKVRVL